MDHFQRDGVKEECELLQLDMQDGANQIPVESVAMFQSDEFIKHLSLKRIYLITVIISLQLIERSLAR